MESFPSHEKPNNRELFTIQDVEAVSDLIQHKQLRKIFIVGAMGAGKSSFASTLAAKTGLPHVELDQYARLYEQENGSRSGDIRKTLAFAIAKQGDMYIADHAELLGKDLEELAEMVVLLDPRHEELIRSYEERTQKGSKGGWSKFGPDELARISTNIAENFNRLSGEIAFEDIKTGVQAKVLRSRI